MTDLPPPIPDDDTPPPLPAVLGTPALDLETYSEAGYVWRPELNKWRPLPGTKDKGLPAVGVRVYAEHPTADVFTKSYDLQDGKGVRRWRPGLPVPADLCEHIARGGLIEAHNAGFEQTIWECVLTPKYGFPPVPIHQWRCSAAKARAYGLPGSLEKAGEAMNLAVQKDPEGKALMKVFSMPRDPTKADPRRRITREEDPERAERYDQYCDTDIVTEHLLSQAVPDLIAQEQEFWFCDQAINRRGMGVDVESVDNCCSIVEQCLAKYDLELAGLTGGLRTSQVQALIGWLSALGVHTKSLDSDNIAALLDRTDLPPEARRVLEIRALTGSASVKKVFSMRNRASRDARLCDMFVYHGARTGRDTHADVQPGNLPKAGPALRWCESDECKRPYGQHLDTCPWCGSSAAFSRLDGWGYEAVDYALQVIATRSIDMVEWVFGDAMLTVSGCVRGLLVAGQGKELICSDYSSIEAVVTATLSGEEWRIAAFRNKEDIYLHGAAGVTGKTYDWYMANGGKKHPDRQKIGKVAELALGFGGWIGSWRNFDKTDTYSDDEVKALINKWRSASPMLVELWGGQMRGKPWAPDYPELFGLEGMAIAAILNPGQRYTYRQLAYVVENDVLFCVLPSGRRIAYQKPRLAEGRWPGTYSITYMAWNTNPSMGAIGWVRMETWGSRLTENAVQATARDVMAHAVIKLEAASYPVVLRVHDELASEVPIGFGSVDEYERIMADVPEWCADWPIRAAGGWRGYRYRKD